MSTRLAACATRTPARLAGWPRFVMLDLHSLIPFARTILIAFAVMIVLGLTTAPNLLVAQMFVALGIVMTVPLNLFAADEQAGLESLYQILPIRRLTRVVGRYATVLLTTLVAVVAGTESAFADAAITHAPTGGLAAGLGTLLTVTLLLQAVQLPFYFAVGYQRARLLNFALLAAAAAITILTAKNVPLPQGGVTPPAALLGGGIVAAVGCYVLSAWISLRWYRRREF